MASWCYETRLVCRFCGVNLEIKQNIGTLNKNVSIPTHLDLYCFHFSVYMIKDIKSQNALFTYSWFAFQHSGLKSECGQPCDFRHYTFRRQSVRRPTQFRALQMC